MNNQTRKRLFDACQACLAIEEFTAGTDFAASTFCEVLMRLRDLTDLLFMNVV